MIKKEIAIGFIVGLIANFIGVFLYSSFVSTDGLIDTLTLARQNNFLGKIISIGAILNLIAFFIFIKKKQDYRARGVLLVTVIIAVGTFLIKFF